MKLHTLLFVICCCVSKVLFAQTAGVCNPNNPIPSDPAAAGFLKVFTTGTVGDPVVNTKCDDCAREVILPFTFTFAGQRYSKVYINSNGCISFNRQVLVYSGAQMPSISGLPPMIAIRWADVDTRDISGGDGGNIWYKMTRDSFIVLWHRVRAYPATDTATCTFRLLIKANYGPVVSNPYTDGDVEFSYGSPMGWAYGSLSNGVYPQAGFDGGNGTAYNLAGTLTNQMTTYYVNKCFRYNVKNLAFAGSTNPVSYLFVQAGTTQTATPTFLPATSAVVNTGGLCGVTVGSYNVATGTQPITIAGSSCNLGTHYITIDASTSTASIHHTIQVVVMDAPPVISYPDNLLFFAGNQISPITPTNTGGAMPAANYGEVVTYAGNGTPGNVNGPTALATFNKPGEIAQDIFGNIFVRDIGNHKIRKISNVGIVSDFAPDFTASGNIFTSADGTVSVPSADTIFTYTQAGTLDFTHIAMDVTAGEKLYAYLVDWSGKTTYATSPQNGTINRGTPSGNAANTYGAQVSDAFITGLIEPKQMATWKNDIYTYVLDNGGSRISRLQTGSSTLTTVFSNPAYHFNTICCNQAGVVYAVDSVTKSVYRIGNNQAYFICGGAALPVDGVGANAGFSNPTGLFFDVDGALYISDGGNNKIRKMNYTGYSVTPALPAGMVLDRATGMISGTPATITARANYTITAYNLAGASTKTISIEIDSLLISRACTVGAAATVRIKRSTGSSTINYVWGTGSCPGTAFQTSSFITLNPLVTTTYTVKPTGEPGINCNSFIVTPDPGVVLPDSLPTSITNCLVNGTGAGQLLTINALNADSYQWQKNTVNIPGANAATYILPANSFANSGSYRVVVTNVCNSVVSSATNYLVANKATLSALYSPDTFCIGDAILITAVAPNAVSYQWQKNSVDIAGENAATFAKLSPTVADSGNYTVIISDAYGCGDTAASVRLYSKAGTRSSKSLIVSSKGPVCAGTPATLYIAARNGVSIPPSRTVAIVNGTAAANTDTSISMLAFSYDFWASPNKLRTSTAQSNSANVSFNDQSFIIKPALLSGTLSSIGVSLGTNGITVFDLSNSINSPLLVYDTTLIGWNHFSITFSNSLPLIYINGILRKSGFSSMRSLLGASIGSFGSDAPGNLNMYKGKVDNIRLWPGTLTAADINTIRNNEAIETVNSMVAIAHFTFNNTAEDTRLAGRLYASPTSYTSVDSLANLYTVRLTANPTQIMGSSSAIEQQVITPTTAGNYGYTVTGAMNGCWSYEGTTNVSVLAPATTPVTTTNTSITNNQTDGTTYNYTNSTCNPMATITDSIGGNVLGNTSCTMLKDASVQTLNGQPYLQRHFDVLPTNNGPAIVKLYVTQAEFNAYNTYVTNNRPGWPKAPINGTDATGIANLSITQYHGLPTDGTTGPGGRYDINNRQLIPNSQITTTWNGTYWTLTFPVSGFSGFYISTGNAAPLAIKLTDINAVNVGKSNRVDWTSLIELNSDRYLLERSGDGKHFNTLMALSAKGKPSTYTHWDVNPLIGSNYYRLQMVESSGNTSYSKIVSAFVQDGEFHVEAYPNPAKDALTVKAFGKIEGTARITLTDASGMMVRAAVNNEAEITIHLDGLAAGMYFLHYRDNVNKKVIKLTKL